MGIEIVAIDDDQEMADLLQSIFSRHEISFKHCLDFTAFEQKVREYQPRIVLLDLSLEDDYGLNLFQNEKIMPYLEDSKVLILSSANTADDVHSALFAGATDYILKPFEEEVLLSKVNKYL